MASSPGQICIDIASYMRDDTITVRAAIEYMTEHKRRSRELAKRVLEKREQSWNDAIAKLPLPGPHVCEPDFDARRFNILGKACQECDGSGQFVPGWTPLGPCSFCKGTGLVH